MLRIFCAVSIVVAIAMGMSACQDRDSRDKGTHGSNDPATTQQMDKNS